MKTLLLRSEAFNPDTGKHYHPIVLFKKVKYQTENASNAVHFIASDNGNEYIMNQLSLAEHNVLVRCVGCPDFHWRFNYYNHLDHSLYGRKRAPYESKGIGPPANPLEMEGACKHLMKFIQILKEAGIFLD
jgi:hypothetical protein